MTRDMINYVELHCHSNYSFQEGASSIEDLVFRSYELGYKCLALTDHDNLCGAMEFSKITRSLGIKSIIGVEFTMKGGSHLTLLAQTPRGYANLCRLVSFSHLFSDRRFPQLDPLLLPDHTEGLIALSGCARGAIPKALMLDQIEEARNTANRYLDWFGDGNFYLELQQNMVFGDTDRIRKLVCLGKELEIPLVATNNVHYHLQTRHQLQDCLVAMRHNKTLEETHWERRANAEFYLKSPREMELLFREYPDAISNTLVIAEKCKFDLSKDLNYHFPNYPVPEGFTDLSYLEYLCREAAIRRYGGIDHRIQERLKQEFYLINKHNLAGFLLIYYDVIQIARDAQVDLGLIEREVPIEESPPGRGRGSSVAMLVGYLIGLSHIDPLKYDLKLDRFLPDDELPSVPDIDLDFPRNIREELIRRVHDKYGWDHASLLGMVSTYQSRSAIRGLGKALGLPDDEVNTLAKRSERIGFEDIREEMRAFSDSYHYPDIPAWRNLAGLAVELEGFPKYLAQHPGGMIISSTPLIDQVPVQQSAIAGRYVCHWDKDAAADAGAVKIDFLSLGVLSQMQETVRLIQDRTGILCDLSRIDFDDHLVYSMLGEADTIGIFQVESAAQMQTIMRMKPKNLTDMAHEVAAVRPGVGANDGVAQYLRRRSGHEAVGFDHPLERKSLERTLGIILFQDQVNQLAMDVGGLSPMEADQMRRAFGKKNNVIQLNYYWRRFYEGSLRNGVNPEISERIFRKFNAHYMFPESHAFAFGVTAYQSAWLKYHYPLEFFVGLFNEQPMGFYSLETLKEDARRHGVTILHPDINRSMGKSVIEDEAIRLGFSHVKGIGESNAAIILRQRAVSGGYLSVENFMDRTGLQLAGLENLVDAGAFDSMNSHRRDIRWEMGLRYRPVNRQISLPLPIKQDMVDLPKQTEWEEMVNEYKTMGIYPRSHIMAFFRPQLRGTMTSMDMPFLEEGAEVWIGGVLIRKQRPLGRSVFITLEDEYGHIPLMVFPGIYARYRDLFNQSLLIVRGIVSRKDGTMNIHVTDARHLSSVNLLPKTKNWR